MLFPLTPNLSPPEGRGECEASPKDRLLGFRRVSSGFPPGLVKPGGDFSHVYRFPRFSCFPTLRIGRETPNIRISHG